MGLNNTVLGVVSRKVLPACGGLSYLFPSLRPFSKQPIKRYKKIIADIFPAMQEEEPNDRRIGKLCEYVARNPHQVLKIWFTGELSHISSEFDNNTNSFLRQNLDGYPQSVTVSESQVAGDVQHRALRPSPTGTVEASSSVTVAVRLSLRCAL